MYLLFFFFNDTATTEIYTLSLHDALPIFIITSSLEKETDKREELEKLDVHFIFLKERRFSFLNMLEEIGKLGVDSVLLEGGGQLISAAFQENMIDGGEIFIAPKILDRKSVV